MSDPHPSAAPPDAAQRPAPASVDWVFAMLSEGTAFLPPEPSLAGDDPDIPVMPTLIVLGLVIVLALLCRLGYAG